MNCPTCGSLLHCNTCHHEQTITGDRTEGDDGYWKEIIIQSCKYAQHVINHECYEDGVRTRITTNHKDEDGEVVASIPVVDMYIPHGWTFMGHDPLTCVHHTALGREG